MKIRSALNIRCKTLRLAATAIACALTTTVYAAGNISATNKYAWSENTSWFNFSPTHGGMTVHSTHLAGYAWQQSIGWIKLGVTAGGPYANTSAGDWGVNLDAAGNLSGYAWSETFGWINFAPTHGGVTFNSTNGIFDGYAWGANTGWLHFRSPQGAPAAYNVATAPYTLTVAFAPAGTGTGKVSSISPPFSGNTDYTQQFYYVLPLTLTPEADQYCLFGPWTGCDSTNGTNCLLSLNQDRTATAAFNLDMANAARINSTHYSNLAIAYGEAKPATGSEIQAWGIVFPDNGLVCGGSYAVTLTGGYDQSYGNITGMTGIKGSLTIGGTGSLTVSSVAVE